MSFVLAMKLIFKQLVDGLKKHLWLMNKLCTGIVKQTQQILWDLTEHAREAHIVRSNHTDRLYNTLLKVPGLISLPELQYDKFMDFATMGIQFHKTFYEFEKGWILAHGDEGNTNPNAGITALNLAKKAGKSVVCGHTHKLGLSAYTEGVGGNYRTIWGIETGNLNE